MCCGRGVRGNALDEKYEGVSPIWDTNRYSVSHNAHASLHKAIAVSAWIVCFHTCNLLARFSGIQWSVANEIDKRPMEVIAFADFCPIFIAFPGSCSSHISPGQTVLSYAACCRWPCCLHHLCLPILCPLCPKMKQNDTRSNENKRFYAPESATLLRLS